MISVWTRRSLVLATSGLATGFRPGDVHTTVDLYAHSCSVIGVIFKGKLQGQWTFRRRESDGIVLKRPGRETAVGDLVV